MRWSAAFTVLLLALTPFAGASAQALALTPFAGASAQAKPSQDPSDADDPTIRR